MKRPLEHYKIKFERIPESGNCILEYGIALLESGNLIKAGEYLDHVYGSESFDTTWGLALLHKARIAALLGEVDYMLEFLKYALTEGSEFDAFVYFKVIDNLKSLPEFQQYRDLPAFKEILEGEFDNPRERYDIFEEY